MFKSFIQPLQLFFKGASGKDRHEKQQLVQRLIALEVAYDRLQKECDRLQRDHNQLKQTYSHLQKEQGSLQLSHERLQRDRNELNALFNCADEENQALVKADRALRSQLKQSQEASERLKSEVIYLTQKEEIRAYQDHSHDLSANAERSPAHTENSCAEADDTDAIADEHPSQFSLEDLERVDLSDISVALVGGHETTHREVTEALKRYGLKRCVHVPPHSIASNSRNQIKDKISHCDLIVTITTYVDHSVVRCVKQLRDTRVLAGDVIRISCHGKSGVVRKVLEYFAAQPV
ncbi:MAG: DUF2325 domain-containing protein [Phormidesmis sp.]